MHVKFERRQAHYLDGQLAKHISQPGTMCSRPIENSVNIVVNLYLYDVARLSLYSTTMSNDMCGESLSTVNFEALEKTLATVIDNAQSLDEIEVWLQLQQCVKSVQLAGYLLKSNPPQRDFIMEFRMEDGSTVKKIVNIFDLGNQQFQFHELHDE